jgi:hypothetical protein
MRGLQAFWLLAWMWSPFAALAAETGSIAGGFADERSQVNYVGEAVVVICDAASGYPLDRTTKAPLEFKRDEQLIDHCWLTTADDRGAFQFEGVPVGRYRLFAQSWSGTGGMPALMGNTSQFVHLHGFCDVEVRAGERAVAYVRQLGTKQLRIMTDPEIGGSFLVLSLGPTIGDPILGFNGWGTDFSRNAIGFTHMAKPNVTVFGLPNDRPVYAGLFAYDNSPGVGAATFDAAARDGIIPVIAAWSNGKHDPPPRLKPLTDFLASSKLRLDDLLDLDVPPLGSTTEQEMQRRVVEIIHANPDKRVDVPGHGKELLVDVLAAYGYVDLHRFTRKSSRRAQQQDTR